VALTMGRKYFPPAEATKGETGEKAQGEGEKKAEEAEKAKKDKEGDKAGIEQTDDDKAAALTDDEWVKVDGSEIPKKASVEDGDDDE
jgi:hypothetical protein